MKPDRVPRTPEEMAWFQTQPWERRLWRTAWILAGPVTALATFIGALVFMFLSPPETPLRHPLSRDSAPTRIYRLPPLRPRPRKPRIRTRISHDSSPRFVPVPFIPDDETPVLRDDTLPQDLWNAPAATMEPPTAPPPPQPRRIIRGPHSRPPVPIHKVQPEYPEAARRLKLQGLVILQLVVRRDGTVESVTLLRASHPILNHAAVEAAARWRFRPGVINNRPVAAYYILTLKFQLEP